MSDPDRTNELLLLGQIHGIVQGLKDSQQQLHEQQQAGFRSLNDRMDSMDGRLRLVENKTAVVGALSGGVTGVGVALIVEGIRQWLRRGGAGQ